MIQTSDRDIVIEEQHSNYVRYRHSDGRRWEVHGNCDRNGACLIGAVIHSHDGPVQITSKEHIEELKILLGRERVDSELDVPVGFGFSECCDLRVVVL